MRFGLGACGLESLLVLVRDEVERVEDGIVAERG